MTGSFYRAFEDLHRGSRELIKSRLRVYLPFVEAIKQLNKEVKAIDLGCGRGEWLELLGEVGVEAQGVDIDNSMLSACRALGLSVETAEAVVFLKTLADDSYDIVSGFHIAEHIPFVDLQILVQEALRVLRPAGLLILETPNPENIVVATVNFYVDPTHQRPLPPQLLSFLPQYYGFFRTKILRLQESSDLLLSGEPSLAGVLNGVSPDYAIIAQKNASPEGLSLFSVCFENEYGLTLDTLSSWYDGRLYEHIKQAKDQWEKTEGMRATLQHVDVRSDQLSAQIQQLDARMEQMQVLIQHVDALAQQAHNNLNAVYHSNSWRFTAPMRWMGLQLRLLRQHGLKSRIKAFVKKCFIPIIRNCISFIDNRPVFRRYCLQIVNRLGIYAFLRTFYLRNYRNSLDFYSQGYGLSVVTDPTVENFNRRTQRIYLDLKKLIEKQNGFN